MKPIEIHIEGYKIVIEKENNTAIDIAEAQKKDDEKIVAVPYYPYPERRTTGDWWMHPFANWTSDDVFNTITTNPPTIVRDTMVGKKDKDE